MVVPNLDTSNPIALCKNPLAVTRPFATPRGSLVQAPIDWKLQGNRNFLEDHP